VSSTRLNPSERWLTLPSVVVPALVALGYTIVVHLALWSPTSGDYLSSGSVAGDNPGPAIDALIHGHLSGFVSQQPLMGLTSILLRLPFAALAALVGGGNLLAYRLGALACLLPAVILVGWMARRREVSGELRLAAAAAVLVVLAAPATAQAIQAGHPEEVLAALLVTSAVLAASHDRATWAATLLGLAVGTKQWALIGVVPVLVALSGKRLRAVATAAVLVAATSLPAPLADPAAFRSAARAVGHTHLTNALSVWWPASSALSSGFRSVRELPLRLTRSGVSLLLLGVALAGSVAACVRRGRQRLVDALALLALLALVRAGGDSLPLEYYYVPFLLALGVWEAYTLRRLPVVTLIATGLLAATFGIALRLSADVLNALSLSWTLALGAYLVCRTWLVSAGRSTTVRA
jgi:Glycosyltransferase family 87